MTELIKSSNHQRSSQRALPSMESAPIENWEFPGTLSEDPTLVNTLIYKASIEGLEKALAVLHYYYQNGGHEQGFDRGLQERVQAYQRQSDVLPADNSAVSMIRYGLQDRSLLLEHVANPLFFPTHLAEQLQEQVRLACYPESLPAEQGITSQQLFLKSDLPKLGVLVKE